MYSLQWPKYRCYGFLHDLLPMSIEHLHAQGIQEFLEFLRPDVGIDMDAGHLWNVPLSMFAKAGFRIARDFHLRGSTTEVS